MRRLLYTLIIIALFFFISGGIIWILKVLSIIQGAWSDKLFIILPGLGGAAIAFMAVLSIINFILSLIPREQEASVTSPLTIRNTINVPTTASIPTSPAYSGVLGPPFLPTDPKTIQQREKIVISVYHQLNQLEPSITAIALTGIGGIGKSTLAALIYYYTEEQRTSGKGIFTAEPLWLTVKPALTMADLVSILLKALGKPMPDLGNLSPQSQVVALFNALNTVDKPRLVILDQFENFLDLHTGHALPDRVGVGEWLDALNSQSCRSRVLLTSRPDPKGIHEYPPTYLQTFPVEGLEEAEGIELLRKQGTTGTETELRTAVKRCDGHALSLTLLAALLQKRKLTLAALLEDPKHSQLWTGVIALKLLDSIYKQLNKMERELLVAFSVQAGYE